MKILAVGPHPDDVEFGCAGLLIQEVRQGNQAKILVLSKGEASTSGTPAERVKETRNAAEIIGAELEFLDLGGDCHLRHIPENAIAIARQIRLYRPEIILAPNLDENQHPDHLAAARMVRDAARLARYGGLEELRPSPVHSISNLYFYSITQSFGERPDIVIDTTQVEEQWEAAMRCHETQMKTKGYIDLVLARARALGSAIGTSSAIGLWANDPIRVASLSDLTLSSRNY